MIELRIEIDPTLVDIIESYACEYTGCSPWTIRQDEPQSPWHLSGYFEDEKALEKEWAAITECIPTLNKAYETHKVDAHDWRERYKDFLSTWKHKDLHWVPVWKKDDYPMPPDAVRVLFDAGMAFGTGDHPTTRLCAMRMTAYKEAHPTAFAEGPIIDAGCGSGILAISAQLLGCKNVRGFDNDPEAIRVSRENMDLNQIAPNTILFEHKGLEEGLKAGEAQLLLANIQADILSIHADSILQSIAPGGQLVLSGILAKEVHRVSEHFNQCCSKLDSKLKYVDTQTMGEWSDLVYSHEK